MGLARFPIVHAEDLTQELLPSEIFVVEIAICSPSQGEEHPLHHGKGHCHDLSHP